MADVAASVLARLKNKAAKSGRSYQLCLQLFCQEEFLRRLEKSKYAENLVLKGGLFLYSLTDFDSRVTADVDFLLRKMPNTPEQLQAILEEIIATETGNDFITFEIKTVAPIAVAKKYAGIGASLVARIKNTKTPFGIDFGVGDIIVPRQEKRKIPTQLAASGKQYDGIKEIIDMVRQIIPYNRMLISSDGYLIPLDDRYFRIDAQNLGFKYGGEITCVGMITNIIGEDTDPNDSQNIFATLQFSVNEVLRQLLPTKERNLCVIHPIAVYYGN